MRLLPFSNDARWVLRACFALWALGATALSVPAKAAGDNGWHTAIHYVFESTGPNPLTVDGIRPVLGYLGTDGRARDWLIDGLILYSYRLDHTQTWDNVATYEAALFDEGQVANLARAVSDLQQELGDPSFRLRVYLAVPFVYTPSLSPTEMTAPTKVVMDRFVSKFSQRKGEQLELAGFYWGYAESMGTSAQWPWPGHVAAHCAAVGLQFIWIPYALWDPAPLDWPKYGFTRITPQVNYMKHDCTTARFREIDNRIRTHFPKMGGAEIEFGGVTNPTVAGSTAKAKEKTSALEYLTRADRYNWAERPMTTYYHARLISEYASDGTMREVYDKLYQFVAARPRSSVAARSAVFPDADAYVQKLAPTSNTATESLLRVGTSASGNAYRTWIRFPLPAISESQEVLSAHLHLLMDSGGDLQDGDLYACTGDWSEATLTDEAAPVDTCQAVNLHRFIDAYRYRMNVTEPVRSAYADGRSGLSFMIRKRNEQSADVSVLFKSRENQDSWKPALVIRSACVPNGPCTSMDGCMAGTVTCVGGEAVCNEIAPMPDGTPCGIHMACAQGVCSQVAVDGGGADAGSADAQGVEAGSGADSGDPGVSSPVQDEASCGCRVPGGTNTSWRLAWLLVLFILPIRRFLQGNAGSAPGKLRQAASMIACSNGYVRRLRRESPRARDKSSRSKAVTL